MGQQTLSVGWTATLRVFLGSMLILSASTAHANPYAYSRNGIALTIGNATAFDHQSGVSTNTASYRGSANDLTSRQLDAPQAKAGPGGYPPENTFSPQGPVGQYGRGDSELTSIGLLDTAGFNVAEAVRESMGSAGGSGLIELRFGLIQNSEAPIHIAFAANPRMRVSTADSLERSHAEIAFDFILFAHNGDVPLLTWTPKGQEGDLVTRFINVTNLVDPFSLNTSLDCTDACEKTYDRLGVFSADLKSRMGQTYDAVIRWYEVVRVDQFHTTALPEPSTSALLVGGLAAIALLTRPRRRAPTRCPG